MRNSKIDDWLLVGPRVVLEFLTSVREGATDLTAYHLTWAQASGVSCYLAGVHEHKNLCDMLRVGISTDQSDLSNLLMAEFAVRRLVQIETAVGRNPAAPDYSGLDLIMEQPVGEAGQGFNAWLAGQSECAEAVAFGFGRGRSGGRGPGEQDQTSTGARTRKPERETQSWRRRRRQQWGLSLRAAA